MEFERNLPPTDGGRPVAKNPGTANGTRNNVNEASTTQGWINVNGLQQLATEVAADAESNQSDSAPQLLNSPLPAPPTSNADIDFNVTPENPAQAGVIDNPDSQLRNRET